jgi:hypothetical protein
VLGFVTTGCFIRWVEKNSEQRDIIPWKNECYNKEELIGGAIDQVPFYDDNSKFKWKGVQA